MVDSSYRLDEDCIVELFENAGCWKLCKYVQVFWCLVSLGSGDHPSNDFCKEKIDRHDNMFFLLSDAFQMEGRNGKDAGRRKEYHRSIDYSSRILFVDRSFLEYLRANDGWQSSFSDDRMNWLWFGLVVMWNMIAVMIVVMIAGTTVAMMVFGVAVVFSIAFGRVAIWYEWFGLPVLSIPQQSRTSIKYPRRILQIRLHWLEDTGGCNHAKHYCGQCLLVRSTKLVATSVDAFLCDMLRLDMME